MSLKLATSSTPGRKFKPFVYNDNQAIANNTKSLKLCGRRRFRPLHGGIKSNCQDIYIKFQATIGVAYALELPQGALDWTIGYRGKFSDLMTDTEETACTVSFPFGETFVIGQRHLEGGVSVPDPPMTVTISNLTVNFTLKSDCTRTLDSWQGTVSNSAATNDGWSLPPEFWDPSGSTWTSGQVHPDGRIGTDWRFYNTLGRFGAVTYGPQVRVIYGLVYFGLPTNEPDGFTTISKYVNLSP